MKKYKHFTKAERLELAILLGKGYSQRDIAETMNRSPSTISRELRRCPHTYKPENAHVYAYTKRKYSKYQCMKILTSMKLRNYIEKYLRLGWSPEQLAGRIAKEKNLENISHTSIYKYIRSVYGRKLEHELKLNRKKRGKRTPRSVLTLENRIFIDKRPKHIETRSRFGDWEGDFIVSGKKGSGAILVLHERKSRYVLLRKVVHKTIEEVHETLTEMTHSLTNFNSLTLDNDIAFRRHEELSKIVNAPVYFCHPYHAWEKGGVESSCRYVRRWVPKGIDINEYTDDDIADIQDWMNKLPRKVICYATPEEVMIQNEQLIMSPIQVAN